MPEEKTITQESWTGEIELTKEEYRQRWRSHLIDNEKIAKTPEELVYIREFNDEMMELVDRNFDDIYESQNQ